MPLCKRLLCSSSAADWLPYRFENGTESHTRHFPLHFSSTSEPQYPSHLWNSLHQSINMAPLVTLATWWVFSSCFALHHDRILMARAPQCIEPICARLWGQCGKDHRINQDCQSQGSLVSQWIGIRASDSVMAGTNDNLVCVWDLSWKFVSDQCEAPRWESDGILAGYSCQDHFLEGSMVSFLDWGR